MKLRVLVPELTVDGTKHLAGEIVEVPNNEASRLIRTGYATPNLSEQSDTATLDQPVVAATASETEEV